MSKFCFSWLFIIGNFFLLGLPVLACSFGQGQPAPTVTPEQFAIVEPTNEAEPTTPAGTTPSLILPTLTNPPTLIATEPAAVTPTLAPIVSVTPLPAGEPLTITAPNPGQSIATGSSFTVSGQVQTGNPQAVKVQLLAAGRILAESNITLGSSESSWQTLLTVPERLAGPATLQVSLENGPSLTLPILLNHPGEPIQLSYPLTNTLAVAGYTLFFSGRVQNPTDNTVTIALLTDNCQTITAQQSFTVGGGGNWYGYIVLPETTLGPACAMAYFGPFDQPGWKAAQVPLSILAKNDPAAVGVHIGLPAGYEIAPGQSLTLFGTAYNVPDGRLTIQIGIGSQIIAEGTAIVDRFGYWEVALTIPAGTTAPTEALITANYGDPAGATSLPIHIK